MLGSFGSHIGYLLALCPVYGRDCSWVERLAKATLEVMVCSHGCYELTLFEARAMKKGVDALHFPGENLVKLLCALRVGH